MSTFPIGFWNYTTAGDLGPEAVKDWTDLGMNFSVGPFYAPGGDRGALTKLLDACAECGVKVYLSDARAHWMEGATDEEYTARFLGAVEDFGRHPAVAGFHAGDEPFCDSAFAAAAQACRLQRRAAPWLTPHLNFMPYDKGQEKTALHAASFGDWAESFARKAELPLFCYDNYTQLLPGEAGVHRYFMNLREYGAAAKAACIPMWTTLLSVGHFQYRVPSEDDFRWQLSTAVASGAKGIMWFFVYMVKKPFSNYRVPPIDEFGERTEVYARMSRVIRDFQHQFGDFFARAEHIATYHKGKAYGEYPLFIPGVTDPVLRDVTCFHPRYLDAAGFPHLDLPMVIGLFSLDGMKHVALVNNSMTDCEQFILRLPKSAKTFDRLSWDGTYESLKDHAGDAAYQETENEITGGDWLAPGQMKVYRIG
jgi:hypothetical protein